jgi:hypothetical protein
MWERFSAIAAQLSASRSEFRRLNGLIQYFRILNLGRKESPTVRQRCGPGGSEFAV